VLNRCFEYSKSAAATSLRRFCFSPFAVFWRWHRVCHGVAWAAEQAKGENFVLAVNIPSQIFKGGFCMNDSTEAIQRDCDADFMLCLSEAEALCQRARIALRQRRYRTASHLFEDAADYYRRAAQIDGVFYGSLASRLQDIEREQRYCESEARGGWVPTLHTLSADDFDHDHRNTPTQRAA
jgi:hypothetical protein